MQYYEYCQFLVPFFKAILSVCVCVNPNSRLFIGDEVREWICAEGVDGVRL